MSETMTNLERNAFSEEIQLKADLVVQSDFVKDIMTMHCHIKMSEKMRNLDRNAFSAK